MTTYQQLMADFINGHRSSYVGKYKYSASYQNGDYSYRCRYYVFDENFKRIDIFIDISYKDKITYHFSENLNEPERMYLVRDMLIRMSERLSYPSMLHYSLYDNFIKNMDNNQFQLKPVDYCNILEYMKFHERLSQKTIDKFYKFFIPCLENMLEQRQYDDFLQSVILILKDILYENEWDGINLKYLDTEYQYHLYYIRQIITMVYNELDKFMTFSFDKLEEAIGVLCTNDRFAFMTMSDFGNLVLSNYNYAGELIETLKDHFVLNDKDEERADANLVFSYIYYLFKNDYEQYKAVLLNVLRGVINNMLTYANYGLDLALGNSIIESEGYGILLDLFHLDYNTFVFTCFPISSFPEEMIPQIRKELEGAIQFFAARMENDKYRLSSFEQVSNINRLLMDNFGGWYK